jgi:hypothetical protein
MRFPEGRQRFPPAGGPVSVTNRRDQTDEGKGPRCSLFLPLAAKSTEKDALGRRVLTGQRRLSMRQGSYSRA